MKLLMIGADSQGSWQMRGVQLGRVLGARVTLSPTAADVRWAEAIVLVKRAACAWASLVKDAKVPVLWDVLDFWAQPQGNGRVEADLVREVRQTAAAIKAVRLIGATQAMATAIGGDYLPHHCRIGLSPTPIRARAGIVGYDGSKRYLGAWLPALERACAALRLTLVINPPDLRTVDVLVSLREGRWDGWACREWKSGVKYVNAIVAGRPILSQPTAAYTELHPVGEIVTRIDDLTDALTEASRDAKREAAYAEGVQRAAGFTVEAVADRYQALLRDVVRCAA